MASAVHFTIDDSVRERKERTGRTHEQLYLKGLAQEEKDQLENGKPQESGASKTAE